MLQLQRFVAERLVALRALGRFHGVHLQKMLPHILFHFEVVRAVVAVHIVFALAHRTIILDDRVLHVQLLRLNAMVFDQMHLEVAQTTESGRARRHRALDALIFGQHLFAEHNFQRSFPCHNRCKLYVNAMSSKCLWLSWMSKSH